MHVFLYVLVHRHHHLLTKMDHDTIDSSEYSFSSYFNGGHFNMFQPDFMPEETDFDTLISAIRSEPAADPIESFYSDYGYNQFTNAYMELPLGNDAVFAAGADFGGYEMMDPNLGQLVWNQEVEDMKYDDSSETATTNKPETTKRIGGEKGDRTRTLISERKRRNGMKEKLYELRSLVPNITKMDKASIVGDAARYIQDLQTQSRKLRAEIATIEATKTLKTSSSQNSKMVHASCQIPTLKMISKLDMFQVEEKEYYVRLICNKGRGVAASLHRALESLTSFQVQSSNLSTVNDDFVLTFTLDVAVCEFDINLPNLKLWLSSAFVNQGFQFNTFRSR
ncbi:putative transcription factor bHLH family [Helianthus annuus]|nr:putative transcription factor bHLH family [Helianthus annuus]KAJ0686865.1 putative transcription factor bHLH family [Helianthus annuus]